MPGGQARGPVLDANGDVVMTTVVTVVITATGSTVTTTTAPTIYEYGDEHEDPA